MNVAVLFLLLLHYVHIITSTVYTVTPDDHYYPNTTCHHCHNLQHYLLNVTNYFTSNTQLLFLPGLHHLHTDLIIQNVHNISLIGSTANGTTLDTVIQCNSSVVIQMDNITNLTMKNFIIQSCQHISSNMYNGFLYNHPVQMEKNFSSVIIIKDCSSVLVHNLQIYENPKSGITHHSLEGINILGNSHFSHISCLTMLFCYTKNQIDEQKIHQNLLIEHYESKQHIDYSPDYAISFSMSQVSYRITVYLCNTTFQNRSTTYILIKKINEMSTLHIMNCTFQLSSNTLLTACMGHYNIYCSGSVYFINCQFLHNTSPSLIIAKRINIKLEHCIFYNNSCILKMNGNDTDIYMKNTTFKNVNFNLTNQDMCANFIEVKNSNLYLNGSITFVNISCKHSIISLIEHSTIIIYGLVTILNNNANSLFCFSNSTNQYMIIKETTYINISQNQVCLLFNLKKFHAYENKLFPYPYCFFQYFKNEVLTKNIQQRNFSITLYENLGPDCHNNIPITKCHWLLQSGFKDIIPADVNKQYVQYNNKSDIYDLSIKQSTLCICSDKMHPDCHISDLGYLYPGQTLTIFLYHKQCNKCDTEVIIKTDHRFSYEKSCTVMKIAEHRQFMNKPCTKMSYTIGFHTGDWCELFLTTSLDVDDDINLFYVRKLRCPPGFTNIGSICQCDSVITNYIKITCDINDQTILRPANSWISATTHNNSYTYHISLHCSFHYCLPHSSHLNFSTPNSQCQFNRSGVLCGHCQQGLSTVFSSSQCEECSNVYILLIIPIAVSGFVIVILLFILNLTVTDGTVNTFILYVNIISINTPVFFPRINHFTPTYTFISIANLDLGIQTCFYNGMDDYAKMWLQLAFPFYLIFIATLIIITSRYSTTIQRLTARRALPVLATLFLLSYTKILRIVSSVLFFYSTIADLPSKHTTLVWSVDANVPLFGVKFTILFIVCLILFLILVPFNVILLFTRTLSRFRFVNKFKPLLDAYQGPYKDTFHFWTGLQLLLRVVFFGLSSLDRDSNLIAGAILLAMFGGICGVIQPFKSKVKNYQELVLIFNLHGLYVISLHKYDHTFVNILIIMVAVHFTLIIMYHIIAYTFGGVVRNKMQLIINILIRWVNGLKNRFRHQQFQLEENIRNNIPEVAFNYGEYLEPLVGQDH